MNIGDTAPDFALKNQNNENVSLKDYRGKKVLLVFYPKDDSPVCTTQLCEYNKGLDEFSDLGIDILAISTDTTESHKIFSEKRNLKFNLLSDKKKEVSKAYGVMGLYGFSKRAIILIDEDGKMKSGVNKRRVDKLKIDDLFEDIDDKLIPFMELQKKYNMTADNFAYIGDDDFDIPLLEEVGFSCCPANAMDEVKKHVNYVCKKNGGEGAIREVIDLFLKAKNLI